MGTPVLEIARVSKRFGQHAAVCDLSLSVHEGDVYGFLGPNGAGKTTTIRMIFGLIRPTAGEVTVAGRSVLRQRLAALSCLGGIIEYPVFPGFLTAREVLWHLGSLAGGIAQSRIEEVLKLVHLSSASGKPLRTYSLGMRQRLGIAHALLMKPRLIVLDEPTNGLDPAGIIEVRSLIKELARSQSVTVFLSSHQLHEVQLICNRVGILNKGQLVAEGEVTHLLRQDTLPVIVQTTDVPGAVLALQAVPWVVGVTVVDGESDRLIATVVREHAGEMNRFLMERGVLVQAIQPQELSLEDLFIRLTGGEDHVASGLLGDR